MQLATTIVNDSLVPTAPQRANNKRQRSSAPGYEMRTKCRHGLFSSFAQLHLSIVLTRAMLRLAGNILVTGVVSCGPGQLSPALLPFLLFMGPIALHCTQSGNILRGHP